MNNIYQQFKSVLDDNSTHINFDEYFTKSDFKKEKIYKQLTEFVNNSSDTIFLSLSGGVDSSVLAYCFKFICEEQNKKLICLHLDYGNRDESVIEKNFIIEYCKILNCELIIYNFDGPKRGEIKRSEYESYTTKIRYTKYKNIIEQIKSEGVVLGHHTDDKIENVFTNIMKGRSLNDLSVINNKSIVNEVTVLRPLMGFYKREVFDFAHKYGVPYFKNTTPSWSIRGQIREEVFPKLRTMFNRFESNLETISSDIDEMSKCILDNVITPFMDNSITKKGNIIYIQKPKIKQTNFFWKTVLMKLLYSHKISMISNKSFKIFMNNIDKHKANLHIKNNKYIITTDTIEIHF